MQNFWKTKKPKSFDQLTTKNRADDIVISFLALTDAEAVKPENLKKITELWEYKTDNSLFDISVKLENATKLLPEFSKMFLTKWWKTYWIRSEISIWKVAEIAIKDLNVNDWLDVLEIFYKNKLGWSRNPIIDKLLGNYFDKFNDYASLDKNKFLKMVNGIFTVRWIDWSIWNSFSDLARKNVTEWFFDKYSPLALPIAKKWIELWIYTKDTLLDDLLKTSKFNFNENLLREVNIKWILDIDFIKKLDTRDLAAYGDTILKYSKMTSELSKYALDSGVPAGIVWKYDSSIADKFWVGVLDRKVRELISRLETSKKSRWSRVWSKLQNKHIDSTIFQNLVTDFNADMSYNNPKNEIEEIFAAHKSFCETKKKEYLFYALYKLWQEDAVFDNTPFSQKQLQELNGLKILEPSFFNKFSANIWLEQSLLSFDLDCFDLVAQKQEIFDILKTNEDLLITIIKKISKKPDSYIAFGNFIAEQLMWLNNKKDLVYAVTLLSKLKWKDSTWRGRWKTNQFVEKSHSIDCEKLLEKAIQTAEKEWLFTTIDKNIWPRISWIKLDWTYSERILKCFKSEEILSNANKLTSFNSIPLDKYISTINGIVWWISTKSYNRIDKNLLDTLSKWIRNYFNSNNNNATDYSWGNDIAKYKSWEALTELLNWVMPEIMNKIVYPYNNYSFSYIMDNEELFEKEVKILELWTNKVQVGYFSIDSYTKDIVSYYILDNFDYSKLFSTNLTKTELKKNTAFVKKRAKALVKKYKTDGTLPKETFSAKLVSSYMKTLSEWLDSESKKEEMWTIRKEMIWLKSFDKLSSIEKAKVLKLVWLL